MEMMQELLMRLCCWGLAPCVTALFFAKVVIPAWNALRKFFGDQGLKGIILIPGIVCLCWYGMTKGYSGRITYDSGIKSGTTANLVSNDTINIYWQRDISSGIWVPDSAAVYIDYREIGQTNLEWGLLAQSTVGAGSWSGTLTDATNYDYNVWAYYVPPEPVHTNGVWVYKTFRDRKNDNILPLRNRIEVNGIAIATPAEKRKDFRGFRKITDYLYEIKLDESYPEYCEQWYHDHYDSAPVGGCSVYAYGSSQYRNYDWKYDAASEVVVHIPSGEGRFGTVGVANLGTNLTDIIADTYILRAEKPDMLKALAGMTTDGMNTEQLKASILVVPYSDRDSGWHGTSLNALGAVRYAIDHFDDPEEAAAYLANNVYIPGKLKDMGYSFHYVISGYKNYSNSSYLVEDGRYYARSGQFWLTNFRIAPVISYQNITRANVAAYDPYGTGFERYTFMKQNWSSYTGLNLLKEVWFSKAYNKKTNPPFPWPTEFVGATPELTLNSSDDDLRDWAKEHVPESRIRGNGTWQTIHSAQYYTPTTVEDSYLKLMVQENDTIYTFHIDWED